MKVKVNLGGLGALGLLAFVALAFVPIGISLYGLVLAFKASLLIGVLALIIEPAPFIIGLVYLVSDVNIAQKAAELLNKL